MIAACYLAASVFRRGAWPDDCRGVGLQTVFPAIAERFERETGRHELHVRLVRNFFSQIPERRRSSLLRRHQYFAARAAGANEGSLRVRHRLIVLWTLGLFRRPRAGCRRSPTRGSADHIANDHAPAGRAAVAPASREAGCDASCEVRARRTSQAAQFVSRQCGGRSSLSLAGSWLSLTRAVLEFPVLLPTIDRAVLLASRGKDVAREF